MQILKRWRERRAQKRKLKDLGALAGGLRTLDQMEESGLIAWNVKQRQLFIDSNLALVMMRTVESWQNFINNVFLWRYSKECEQAWKDFFLKEELAAVRRYKQEHKGVVLRRDDVERIREARRQEILQTDMDAPRIEGFEFFIVSPPDLSAPADDDDAQAAASGKNNPVGRLTAVGHYDPETEQMEMELWSVVEPMLRAANVEK